jgi:hypothetical protein
MRKAANAGGSGGLKRWMHEVQGPLQNVGLYPA